MSTEKLTTAEFTPAKHGGRVILRLDVTAMIPRMQRFKHLLKRDDLSESEEDEYCDLLRELGMDVLLGVLLGAEHCGVIPK